MSYRAFDGYSAPQTANGIDGYATTIRAQSATGTTTKGGNLILGSGTGTATDGYISFRAGNVEKFKVSSAGTNLDGYLSITNLYVDGYARVHGNESVDGYVSVGSYVNIIDGYLRVDGYTTIDGYELIFDGYALAPFIRQVAMPIPGLDGYHLSIKAQASTVNPGHGGDVKIQGGDGYNGDGYIRDGYVKLYSGNTESARVVPNKFFMISGQRINLTNVTTTPITVLDGYFALMVDSTTLAITVNLPASPQKGDTYTVKDSTGNAAANNVITAGNGHTIDGASIKTITSNYGALKVTYNGTQWNLLSTFGTVT